MVYKEILRKYQDMPPAPELFKLAPALKDYIWGGDILKNRFGKFSDMPVIAESWELSTHPDGPSLIATGELAGTELSGVLSRESFPILIKLIDAKESLSVQVHPDDDYALKVEGEPGKTELWVIIDCEKDAFLYHGFDRHVTRKEVRQRMEDGSLLDILKKRFVKPGDAIFIPAGTIHAIGGGILLAEVQQASNSTYRVFDYGRGRPLHVEKALDVMRLEPSDHDLPEAKLLCAGQGYVLEQIVQCPYFTVQRLSLEGQFIMSETVDMALLCLEGAVTLESGGAPIYAGTGDCVFCPESANGLIIRGAGQLLRISL